jgi:hypothetical protein
VTFENEVMSSEKDVSVEAYPFSELCTIIFSFHSLYRSTYFCKNMCLFILRIQKRVMLEVRDMLPILQRRCGVVELRCRAH